MKCTIQCGFHAGWEEDRCGHANYDKPICAIDANTENCPITDEDRNIIYAIGKGAFNCEHCTKAEVCSLRLELESLEFCSEWEEAKWL